MNDPKRLLMPLIFAALLIIGMFIGAKLTPVNRMFSGTMSASIYNYNKLQDILYLIERDYVDEVDQDHLVDLAIEGMLKQLDPHSVYISAGQLTAVNEEISGNFEGIGVQFSILNDTVVVINVIRGGPAEKAGLLGGDRITEVDGEVIAGRGISNDEVMKLLKGKKGSVVKVGVMRQGRRDVMLFDITRDVIATRSIDAAYMINGRTAYVRMNTFAEKTYTEFMHHMHHLEQSGMKNLILDLRGNGGGLLDQAVRISNEFLGRRELIVYTMGKSGKRRMHYANGKGRFQNTGLAVLIDDFSASASEIVAGAIQDNDRGHIIGRRSFGKGLVQQQVMLIDGSAIRITTERYYTPVGRSIQKPYAGGQDDYYNELLDRYTHGGMQAPDTATPPDSLKFETIKEKRTVYGGGGIMPDHFIPIHPKHENELFRNLSRTGVIFEFSADFADRYRSEITTRYDSARYVSSFVMSSADMNAFWDYVADKGIMTTAQERSETGTSISRLVKAFVARDLYGIATYYSISNQRDEAVKKALKVL